MKFARNQTPPWHGTYFRYDLVKELVVAFVFVLLLTVAATIVLSSPDEKPSTIAQWAQSDPADFVTTATGELAGTSSTATYGPPYNHGAPGQHAWEIRLQKWLGVSHRVNTAEDFVIEPLATIPGNPVLREALRTYRSARSAQQKTWTDTYSHSIGKEKFTGGIISPTPAKTGPVATMMQSLLSLAQSGGLDGALLTSNHFFQTDYTKPLLFLNDGGLLADRAKNQHLLGTQWGMMNETGSYPGQAWLWLYTFWYQIKPFSTSHNADILVWLIMAVLSLAFICIPFIPGVRDIPRVIPIYRLIWRRYYREAR